MTNSPVEVFYTFEKKELRFKFPAEYRTLTWHYTFNVVENNIKERINQFDFVYFDFSDCIWADPIPLLSLVILIKNLSFTKSIFLIIPDVINKDVQNSHKKRFVAFLYAEEFIDLLKSFNTHIITIDNKEINVTKPELEELSKYLIFQGSSIHAPVLVDLQTIAGDNPESITLWVRDFVKSIEHRLKRKVPNYYFKTFVGKLNILLAETLTNSYEHAYSGIQKKFAVFYIRYRYGLINDTIDKSHKTQLEKSYQQEYTGTTRLMKSFAESNAGFIEVFIFDAGMGIIRSFSSAGYKTDKTYPFRAAINAIITKGNRNAKHQKNTKYGGLYTLSRLIDKGFLWIKDQSEFFGEELPFTANLGLTDIKPTPNPATGFPMIARISWNQGLENNYEWHHSSRPDGQINQHVLSLALHSDTDIYNKYYGKHYKEFTNNPVYIRDERFDIKKLEIFTSPYHKNEFSENFILYLPPEGLLKHEINKIISSEFNHLVNPSRALIIADIIEYEAALYQYAIEGATFPLRFVENFDSIILVTRTLSVMVLTIQSIDKFKSFRINPQATVSFIENQPERFSPQLSLLHLIEWIKTHDSILYWRYLFTQLPYQDYFFTGGIDWIQDRKKHKLDTYFNFGQTLSSRMLLQLYNICLERLKVFRKYGYTTIVATDNLVNNIIEVFNAKKVTDEEPSNKKILVNSVLVTGLTIENAGLAPVDYAVSFFHNKTLSHYDYRANKPHFFLWPDNKILTERIENKVEYGMRVGCSPFIAPNGWKYYTIPRYKHKDYPALPIYDVIQFLKKQSLPINENDFIPVSASAPLETYKDWQSKSLLSIGHFAYGSYHDILKVDIPFGFDESWILNGPLACFIISEICGLFKIEIELLELDTIFKGRIEKYRKNYLHYNNINQTPDQSQSIDLIIYPYHYATEHIFRKLKDVFPDDFSKKMISLMPVQYNSLNTPIFFPPQVIGRIKQHIIDVKLKTPEKQISVLLVDTVKINGKTEKEIRHILSMCGVEKFSSMVLLDRQRLPIHSFESEANTSYWKLDVPILGSKNNCIICKTLDKLIYLKEGLTNELFIERIDDIIRNWTAVFRYTTNSDNHGIRAVDINLKNKGSKRFGVYNEGGEAIQIGGDKNKITITDSYGLTIYCCEILSMTTRDDIVFDFFEEQQLPPEAIMETSCMLLLLYPVQLSNGTRMRLLKKIFDLCKNYPAVNNHTALCLITLVSFRELLAAHAAKWSIEAHQSNFDIQNLDILLFLSELAYTVSESGLTAFSPVRRLLKQYAKSTFLIKEFHCTLYNDYGTQHNEPLHILSQKEELTTKYLLREAVTSVKKLRHLLNAYDISQFMTTEQVLTTEEDFRGIDAHIERLSDKVALILMYTETEFTDKLKLTNKDLSPHFSYLIDSFKLIHQELFIPFNLDTTDFLFRDKLNEIIDQTELKNIGISKHFLKPLAEKNSNIKERWVPWNTKIHSIVRDILSNARHISHMIKEYMPDGSRSELLISIRGDFDDKYYCIHFINRIGHGEYDTILKRLNNKHKPSEAYLNSIGGKLNYLEIEHKGQHFFDVQLFLPFI